MFWTVANPTVPCGSSVIDSTVGVQLTGPVQLRGTALKGILSLRWNPFSPKWRFYAPK